MRYDDGLLRIYNNSGFPDRSSDNRTGEIGHIQTIRSSHTFRIGFFALDVGNSRAFQFGRDYVAYLQAVLARTARTCGQPDKLLSVI